MELPEDEDQRQREGCQDDQGDEDGHGPGWVEQELFGSLEETDINVTGLLQQRWCPPGETSRKRQTAPAASCQTPSSGTPHEGGLRSRERTLTQDAEHGMELWEPTKISTNFIPWVELAGDIWAA